ncbi:MAG: hypothetical protein ACRC4M_04700 [Mycoplasma sp.]
MTIYVKNIINKQYYWTDEMTLEEFQNQLLILGLIKNINELIILDNNFISSMSDDFTNGNTNWCKEIKRVIKP